MGEEAEKTYKELYRKLLNSESGKYLDAAVLVDRLVAADLCTDDERKIVQDEPKFCTQQYLLFLLILPKKGKIGLDNLITVLGQSDCNGADEFLKYESEEGRDVTDFGQNAQMLCRALSDEMPVCYVSGSMGIPDDAQEPVAAAAPPFVPRMVSGAKVAHRRMKSDKTLVTNEVKPFEIQSTAKEFEIDPSMFEFGPKLGDGGFADVFGAIYKNQQVAVKQFRKYDDFALTMFYEEVNVMRQLHHPNVLRFIGYAHKDHVLWLVTEFVPGGSMRRFCEPNKSGIKPLDTLEKLTISDGSWQGLDYLHSRNLCHKDISPANILISDDLNEVKIADFGLAEFKQISEAVLTSLKGTAMYYPPEFASEHGIMRHPALSDVYSMGASLCELFSEQWFWNVDGKRRSDFQVMYILSEQRQALDKGHQFRDPDCWSQVMSEVRTVLQWAICVDLNQRKSSNELFEMTKTLIADFS